MTSEEVKAFIQQQSVLHRTADESFEYEQIELDTFRAILRFALAEGFIADDETVRKTLEGVNLDPVQEDDEYTTWHYMYLLLEQIDEEQTLSPKSAELLRFWKTEFWGADETEES
jgi:hypothetical protein